MTPKVLDFYFPFVVFFYGFLAVLVLETPVFVKLGRQKMNDVWRRMEERRGLAWLCFFIGGIWSLQNLWFQ